MTKNHVRLYSSLLAVTVVSFSAAIGQGEVAQSAAEAKPIKAGAMVPMAKLLTLENKPTTLKAALGGKPTLLVFYRGGWCPFCNRHLAELGQIQDDVVKRGYQIVAISPDLPDELNKTLDKNHLPYKLFSDSTAEAMKKFGVAFRLDDKTFDTYRNSYKIDLERSSGHDHHILPVPSVFVIDKAGKITFASSNPDYKIRMSGKDILAALDRR